MDNKTPPQKPSSMCGEDLIQKTNEVASILKLAASLNRNEFNEEYLNKLCAFHRLEILESLEVQSQFVKDFCSGDILILEKIK
jgi:hypothetical protein